jgi:putative flippase GtrA
MRDLIAKLVRYVFTGGLAAIVDAGGFALLVMAKFAVAPAAATSFCVAAVVNYRLTSRMAFRHSATGRGFALFLLAALIGLLVNVSVTLSAIAVLGLPPLAAKIAGIGTAFLLNFALNVGIVFRTRKAI